MAICACDWRFHGQMVPQETLGVSIQEQNIHDRFDGGKCDSNCSRWLVGCST